MKPCIVNHLLLALLVKHYIAALQLSTFVKIHETLHNHLLLTLLVKYQHYDCLPEIVLVKNCELFTMEIITSVKTNGLCGHQWQTCKLYLIYHDKIASIPY